MLIKNYANPMITPFMFPFLTTYDNTNENENSEYDHETALSEESFLPENVYSSFTKTEEFHAKNVEPDKILVTYKSREKTNDNPPITKSEKIIITPRGSKKPIKDNAKKTKRKKSKGKKNDDDTIVSKNKTRGKNRGKKR
tara:strand:- start:2530 stop:2949 length:420 start_codon:yes stop_codon:yes gene_type:complete